MYKLGLAAAAMAVVLTGCGNGGSASPIASAHAASATDASTQSRVPDLDLNRLNALVARAAQNPKGGLLIPAGDASAVKRSTTGVTPKALNVGWNAIDPVMCVGQYYESSFYMTVVASDESLILILDPVAISMIAPACVDDGKAIVVNVTSQVETGVYEWAGVATLSN